MDVLALCCYLGYLTVIIGVRAMIQRRQSGAAGVKLMQGQLWTTEWWASLLFGIGMSATGWGPLLVVLGVVQPIEALDTPVLHVIGFVLFAVGLVTTFSVQLAMGKSWRIGVDESEVTALVVDGPFAVVRNPIFAAILLTFSGLLLMLPNVVSLAAIAILLTGVELTVRKVEEPYLMSAHRREYAAYAGRVGRLLPGIGRLRGGDRQPG